MPSVKIVNLDRILSRFRLIGHRLFSKSLMDEIGMYVVARVQVRTAEGKDVNNVNFLPYSPRYRLFRQKTGHPSSKVNLFYTGSMMSSMTHDAEEDQVRIFFMNTRDRSGVSNPLKAYALNQTREFFAVNEDEQRYIFNMVREHADRVLERD